ncbi:MAG: hypothetical protein GWN00_19850 [Aliifodinibius sp.]|nr:hypothetical protein [Fodinibius sp.]NIY26975.1 hypothetical protein [Fodinibius sp.]
MRTALANDGRIRVVAKSLKAANVLGNADTNAYCASVLGSLVTLWCLADEQADENGVLVGYDFDDVDRLVGLPGFCESLPEDWICLDAGWVKLPDYLEHNGKNAKVRAQTAKRVAKSKQKKSNAQSVTEVTKNPLPREEKRREENNNPLTPLKGDKRKRFSPPSIDQVTQYCKERQNNVDPTAFINHYQMKGWMVGKSKMVDWQAAVRTWERNQQAPLSDDLRGAI